MNNGIKYLFLFLCIPYVLSADVLKIQPIFNCFFKDSMLEFKKIMMPLLEKNDIVFVDQNPDVILIFGRPIKNMQSLKHPIIVLDEEESASIVGKSKESLRNPSTIALFKNTTLRPKSLYNDTPFGKYHFKIINNDHTAFKKRKSQAFSKTMQRKIQSVLWDTRRSAFSNNLKPLTTNIIDFEEERPVDVFFAGTVNLKRPPGHHRKKLFKKLETIKNLNIVTHIGRLPKEEYFDLLKKSKIVVSPWGNGEWCWRDYEAIYSGALVIKPDTSFVQSVPDLYCNDKYYVACKPDFSDLEKKISYVLENYNKFTDMRKKARALLINRWDHEKIAQDLAKAIRQALKK